MKTETEKVLIRLKTWLGKERARFERLRQDPHASSMSKERAFGEATVCSLTMSRIDNELRKLRAPKESRVQGHPDCDKSCHCWGGRG